MAKKKSAPPAAKSLLYLEVRGLAFLVGSISLLFALWSFIHLNPGENWLGRLGYGVAFIVEYLFGWSAYALPTYLFWRGVRFLQGTASPPSWQQHLFFSLFAASSAVLLTVFAASYPSLAKNFAPYVYTESVTFPLPKSHTVYRYNLGGVLAYFLYADLPMGNFERTLGPFGTTLLFGSLAILSFLALTRLSLKGPLQKLPPKILSWIRTLQESWASRKKPLPPPKLVIPTPLVAPKEAPSAPQIVPVEKLPSPKKSAPTPSPSFSLPSAGLLSNVTQKVDSPTIKKDLLRQAAILEETLKSFGIEAKVGDIHSGPTITSFEVHPAIGVKVQKIKTLENDIALNMQAKSIRIVAPIPGKAAVGVEVPTTHPQEVNFREMLQHYQHKQTKKLSIPILLGKAINGDWVFSDLAKMPHLLIAGATGSGKSVCVNTIVMSILMNASPDEIKLLMIDPKKVELTQYSELPHMLAPVITEPHGAYAALQWLVKEMQLRYEILKQLGLRNITALNTRKRDPSLEASLPLPIPEKLPYIVAIVDEFADLMMVSSADLETPIARIAQMARAVGIHLILATQRPSREVITGIIKANIPTRISFKVASRINSQIILDDTGAESLLGNGDLLFLPPGSSQLLRAQGAYIRDEEIHKVIQAIRKTSPPNYLIPSFDAFRPTDAASPTPEEGDPLFAQALALVTASKSASTTYLQRKLKIGYARAASLIDALESKGIIGPQEGAKPRRVLSSLDPEE